MRNVIELNNLHLTLGDKTILNNVSTQLRSNEVTVLLGPNGTGKSSLLKVMMGEWKKESQVNYFNKPRHQWNKRELAKHVGVLPQSSSLTFNFTVREVVELGAIPLSLPNDIVQVVVDHNMHKTDVMHLAERFYPSLSGGEKQRVHLARVLTQLEQSGEQSILLLDEPTAALDLSHQHNTLQLAKRQALKGAAVVIVMHDLNLAAQYADRIMILNQGSIVADGSPWEVLTPQIISQVYDYQTMVIKHPEHDFPVVLN